MTLGSPWPQRRPPKPIESFDHPAAHTQMPFDANALELPISVKLAGHAGRPTPVELREWLKNPDKANRSAVKELFEGLPGAYLVRLRQCCGGSIYELARLFHHCGIDHWMPVLWIDQFSNDRSKDRSIPQYYE